MFSKPQWFRPGRRRGVVRPQSVAGWIHTAAWSAVLVAPLLLLLDRHRLPEAVIWLGAMGLGWWSDLGPVRRAHRLARQPDLFVIDDATDITRLNTGRFRFAFRKS